jgi:4-hydroxy-3-polyprenylbenzoate decarboxylase
MEISVPAPTNRSYADLHEHLDRLDDAGLLYRIETAINKDTELHPLVRWQFRGGIAERNRKAFLFSNIKDSNGHTYDIPVAVGVYAANAEIYRIGMNVKRLEDIGPAWERAIANPVLPHIVEDAPCHEMIVSGPALEGTGRGLGSLPAPISTPGFDAAPYLTATCVITRDPHTGVQNVGTYRGQLKSSTRLGMMTFVALRAGGYEHWKMHQALKKKMPVAIVVGCPPLVAFQGPQKLPHGTDEVAVAGGLAGGPIHVVRGRTVDLLIPAEAEIVIEGYADPDYLEPEGPFGESHGYLALEEYNLVIDVTAITRRRNAIFTSIISQVTPSESSVIKRLAYEPLFLSHLRNHLGIKGLKRVVLHEPLTNLRKFIFLQFGRGTPRSEVWRALEGALTLQAIVGKFVIAVDDDIDPENVDSVFWAMAYRCNPAVDTHVVPYREHGHGPRSSGSTEFDSALLIDATMKHAMPPLALPKREYMENAKALWERLGLPALNPEVPWFGYSLGDWDEEWDRNARQATLGHWMDRSESYRQRRRSNVAPNTSSRTKDSRPDD